MLSTVYQNYSESESPEGKNCSFCETKFRNAL